MNEPPNTTLPSAPIGFTPLCPTCRYDLSGIPEGPCPECGTPFTLAQLHALHASRRTTNWRAGGIAALWGLAWVVICFMVESRFHDRHEGSSVLLVLWACLVWLFRRELATIPALTCGFMLLCGMIAAYSSSNSDTFSLRSGLHRAHVHIGLGLAALIIAWFFVPRRKPAALLTGSGGAILGLGAIISLTAYGSLVLNQHWSTWPDPRPWQPYIQYPLTTIEALTLGATLTALGLMLTLAIPISRAVHHARKPS